MGLTYVDSCVVIDATQVSDSRGDRARGLLQGDEVHTDLVTSPLVDLECMVRPLRSRNDQFVGDVQAALDRFKHLPISPRAFELAAHMRAHHGFQTPDALHVATASLGGCSEIWTTDQDLLRALPEFAVDPYSSS